MATTKRSIKRGAKARTVKKVTRTSARQAGPKKAGVKKAGAKKTGATKAGATKAAATKARAKSPAMNKTAARTPAAKGAVAAAVIAATAALTKKLKAQFARERGGLERRLTEIVREIGLLRHHELRATQFERQLAERDATIADLRRELESQKSQTSPPPSDTQGGLNFEGGETVRLDDLDETAALDDEDDDLI